MRGFWILATVFFLFAVFETSYFLCRTNFCDVSDKNKYSGLIEKISVANIGEYSIFNLIAENQGYFAKNGLDVHMEEYSSGPPAVSDLLSGKVDFAVAADFVGVRNIFTNKDLRILAQLNKHYTFEIIGRRDKGIIVPGDLKGKMVGVTRKGVGEFFLGRFLSFNRLSLGDIRVVDLMVPGIIDQINNGRIDAAVIFNPHAHEIKKSLGENSISWSAQDSQRVYALLYSRESFLMAHPDIVVRYVRSLLAADNFLKENQAQAKAILADRMQYDSIYIEDIWDNFDFALSLDQSLFLSMEDQARFIMKNGLVSDKEIPNYLNFIYFDALHAVAPERISIIR